MRQFYKNSDAPIPAIAFETEAPTGFTLVTDEDEKQQLWTSKYEERREDGKYYYTESQAKLYIDFINGLYTSVEVFDFENHTSELSNQIKDGNWYTAQTTCTNLPTSGIFNTAKKAEIQADIDSYVLNNY